VNGDTTDGLGWFANGIVVEGAVAVVVGMYDDDDGAAGACSGIVVVDSDGTDGSVVNGRSGRGLNGGTADDG
jgi:hypothetical protein